MHSHTELDQIPVSLCYIAWPLASAIVKGKGKVTPVQAVEALGVARG
jgi:hypothetical protein